MKVLVVGASGVVGASVVRHLSAQQIEHIGLVHTRVPNESQIVGDVTCPMLGVKPGDVQGVTHIVYCAGSTKFDLPIKVSRAVNTTPMHNLLSLANSIPSLQRLIFVSTIYSCGLQEGVIREVRHRQNEFANTYEQSKLEAEKIILNDKAKYTLSIARLSTIVSDDDGNVVKYDSIHRSLQYLYYGLIGVLPGAKDVTVDMISGDYASKRLIQILFTKNPKQIYHVASGDHSLSMDKVICGARNIFESEEPGWLAKGYPEPLYTSLNAFNNLGESMVEAGNIIVGGAYRALATYAPQISAHKKFSTDNTDSLGALDMVETDLLYKRMVHYCLSNKWK